MSATLERATMSRPRHAAAEEASQLRASARGPAANGTWDADLRAPRHAELPPDEYLGSRQSRHFSMRGRLIAAVLALGLLPALLAGAAAFIASHYLAEVWVGRSELIFQLPELSGDAANRFLATQPVIVASYPLVEPIAGVERLPVEEVTRGLSASLVQGSTLMRIEYRDTDQARILRVLEGLTEGYLTLLRDMALVEGASHRLLSAPFVLEEPVGPKPMRAAAIGAVIGLAVAFAGLVVTAQLRRPG